jgi:response regulator RpfG family c-di-GMP phosphodiesterase
MCEKTNGCIADIAGEGVPLPRMDDIVYRLLSHGLFAGLDPDLLARIAGRLERVSFKQDEVICEEGGAGNRMFILDKGSVAVLKDMGWGRRELKRLQSGEVFGEMALISGESRTATIQALCDTTCLVLGREDFDDLLNQEAQFAQRILRELTERLKRSNERVAEDQVRAHKALVFALASMADSRDPETGSHLQRVRTFCARLAEYLAGHPRFLGALYPGFAESLYFVSPLHDIGKVAIPDRILLKPGKLTDEEFETMKTHAARGADMLDGVTEHCDQEMLHMAARIVRYHHERWDGRGYPDGLAGDAIPVEARIMALADVYDALLSRRVYKEPIPHDKVVEILHDGIGTQFDPLITEIMLLHIDDFQEIHRRNQD